MGMYTEIYFRAELARDVPEYVVEYLQRMVGDIGETEHMFPEPEHELFSCPRWSYLGCGGSAYFPITESKVVLDRHTAQWHVLFLANLKNYGGEIGKFFDWIDSFTDARQGEFLGYSLYEEDDNPTLYFRKSEKNYFRLNKEMVGRWEELAAPSTEPPF